MVRISEKYKCIDCGNYISWGCKRCLKCSIKFSKDLHSHNWKGGLTKDIVSYKKKHYLEHSSYQSEKRKKLLNERKKIIFEHYTNGKMECNCCGEKMSEFLTIDHINGGGTMERKRLFGKNIGGSRMYLWIIKNNFPKHLQILCMNCNFAKRIYGECPHKLK
jgi:hypothetical protein